MADPAYDLDGNMVFDGTWNYLWDGENRLVGLTPVTTNAGSVRLSFAYDFMSRRVQKDVETWGGSNWSNTLTVTYTYDGWNMVCEDRSDEVKHNYYVWGLDLSGTLQGAGGIGGLLARVRTGTIPDPIYYLADANGNITDVLDKNGAFSARYTYDGFGRVTAKTGTLADENPFQFSSKYNDKESGLLYYGYRYYSPELGRWLNRDPIGDEAFLNLYTKNMSSKQKRLLRREALRPGYLYVINNPIIHYDLYGLTTCPCGVSTLCCLCAAAQGAAAWSPGSGNENPAGNAQRHCIANCLSYRACGAECAEDFWDGNENPDGSSGQMDLHNNLIGRAAGATTGGCWELCQQAHDDGMLMCDGATGAMCE